MSIKRPDTYEHNNPKEPFVLSKDVKGGALKTADLTSLLSDFVGFEKKLTEGVTKVYVESVDADYRLINIASVHLLTSWKLVQGGGGSSSFAMLTGLPDENTALLDKFNTKLDKTDYNQHFRGSYPSFEDLELAEFNPPLRAGDKAQVNVTGQPVINYTWDNDDNVWVEGSAGSGANNTDELPEGSNNLYFTTERTKAVVELEKKNYEKSFGASNGTQYDNLVPVPLREGIVTGITGFGVANIRVSQTFAGAFAAAVLPMAVFDGNLYIKFDFETVGELAGSVIITGKDN